MASENSSNGSANPSDHETTSWVPPVRRRNPLQNASAMINGGGLGDPTHSRGAQLPPPSQPSEVSLALDKYESQLYPHSRKSLSGIALRAFLLGLILAFSSVLTTYLLYISDTIWRAPFSIACLCLFHFLEFYTTSLTNVPAAEVSSFLLSSNGSAYLLAHLFSMLECLLSYYFLPSTILPLPIHNLSLALGLILLVLGQSIRTYAMYTAGTNFSHFVKHRKSTTHQLVTTGIYSFLRHPSYFGYFWWGIGTQLVYGNTVCLAGFGFVLWIFFARRIKGEEELLVRFFGDEYRAYRGRTWVGIPFIR